MRIPFSAPGWSLLFFPLRPQSSLRRILLLSLIGLNVLFVGCVGVVEPTKQQVTAPIYLTRAQLESSVKSTTARDLHNPGKIYYKDKYIFINEKYKGVHIIDNTNPSNPQNISFIEVPGNVDMAMKGNILYVDNAVDLVALDLTNPSGPTVTSRVRNTFPPLWTSNVWYGNTMPSDSMIIVGWKDTTIEYKYRD